MRYFTWRNLPEKNNCMLVGLDGGEVGELAKGQTLATTRPDPYGYSMDSEYRKNVRLTDSLVNDQRAIVASPTLRDLLVEVLGAKIEALAVNIKDHKGRIATKDYSFINILDLQDCLNIEASAVSFAKIKGRQVLVSVRDMTLRLDKISPEARLFRLQEFKPAILIREDLMKEIVAKKFEGMTFTPVKSG